MQIYATNETRTFGAMEDHVERSVLTSIKAKTVCVVFQLHVSHCAFNKFIKG